MEFASETFILVKSYNKCTAESSHAVQSLEATTKQILNLRSSGVLSGSQLFSYFHLSGGQGMWFQCFQYMLRLIASMDACSFSWVD